MCLFDRNTKFGPNLGTFGPKNVEKKSFKPKQMIGRAKTCREDLRTVIQIDLNYLYLKLLALKCIFWSKNDFWALFWPKKGPGELNNGSKCIKIDEITLSNDIMIQKLVKAFFRQTILAIRGHTSH